MNRHKCAIFANIIIWLKMEPVMDNCSSKVCCICQCYELLCFKDLPDDPLDVAPEVVGADNLYWLVF